MFLLIYGMISSVHAEDNFTTACISFIFFILPLNKYLWEQLGREMKYYLQCFSKSTTAPKKDSFVVYHSEHWNLWELRHSLTEMLKDV